jgi:hypothetical protein
MTCSRSFHFTSPAYAAPTRSLFEETLDLKSCVKYLWAYASKAAWRIIWLPLASQAAGTAVDTLSVTGRIRHENHILSQMSAVSGGSVK